METPFVELWDDPFDLVHQDPIAAERAAAAALAAAVTPRAEAHAAWVMGLALRESGRGPEAAELLEQAHTAGVLSGDRELAARIATSLAYSIVSRGELDRAGRLLSEHESDVTGLDRGRLVMQRAVVSHRLLEFDRAAADYEAALDEFVRAHDDAAQARLRIDFGLLEIQRGRFLDARAQLTSAVEACSSSGQRAMQAVALHNLGFLEYTLDRIPLAIELFAQADDAYAAVSNTDGIALVAVDRAAALSSAGLIGEAADAIVVAVELIDVAGNEADLADTLVRAASLLAAADRRAEAEAAAVRAQSLYEQQSRSNLLALIDLLRLEIDQEYSTARLKRADDLARRFASAPPEQDRASIVAFECAVAIDDRAAARKVAGRLEARRRWLTTMIRIRLDVGCAKLADADGDRPAARRLVDGALRGIRRDNALIGAIELRAHISARGIEAALLGARYAIDRAKPRELLDRLEAMHGFASVLSRRGGVADDRSASLLAELRQVTDQMRSVAALDGGGEQLDRRRAELESAIRAESHRRVAVESEATSMADMVGRLGDHELVEFGSVDGQMWAVRVRAGRATMHCVGALDDLDAKVEGINFSLSRLNRTHGSPASRAAAAAAVTDLAAQLDELLFGRVRPSGRPLVIVPAAEMNGMSWRVLPTLTERPFTLAPSFETWTQASSRGADRSGCLLVAGPDLAGAQPELDRLSSLRPDVVALDGSNATVENTLRMVPDVGVAHLACHGSYRSDNPLFSSLRLVDGDLTVYDLEQCGGLPHTVVLSACNVGQTSTVGGGALLGMASALIQLGVASVIAPLTPVNDERSVDLMVRLHTHLASGLPAAEALAKASIGPDGELDPTAAPFICFGS